MQRCALSQAAVQLADGIVPIVQCFVGTTGCILTRMIEHVTCGMRLQPYPSFSDPQHVTPVFGCCVYAVVIQVYICLQQSQRLYTGQQHGCGVG